MSESNFCSVHGISLWVFSIILISQEYLCLFSSFTPYISEKPLWRMPWISGTPPVWATLMAHGLQRFLTAEILCSTCYLKHFLISFNPHCTPVRLLSSFLFCPGETRGPDRWGDFLKVTQLIMAVHLQNLGCLWSILSTTKIMMMWADKPVSKQNNFHPGRQEPFSTYANFLGQGQQTSCHGLDNEYVGVACPTILLQQFKSTVGAGKQL